MAVDLKRWLPTTKKEIEIRGWSDVDVVLFTGDAYVDHPSFGAAIIGRIIEDCGWRVAIVPQPDWHGDWRDFKKFGTPRRFFAVTAGAMDSMVNHYTAAKRLRHDDAYTPDGRHGARPDRATVVYTKILKQLYPDVPVIIGGIEASLRRLAHYDYWEDRYMPSILAQCGADLLTYGMGEKVIREICKVFDEGGGIEECKRLRQTAYLRNSTFALTGRDDDAENPGRRADALCPGLWTDCPFRAQGVQKSESCQRRGVDCPCRAQGVQKSESCQRRGDDCPYRASGVQKGESCQRRGADCPYRAQELRLHSFEECAKDKRVAVETFKVIEQESNKMNDTVLVQAIGKSTAFQAGLTSQAVPETSSRVTLASLGTAFQAGYVAQSMLEAEMIEVVVNPSFAPISTEEMDRIYELPFTRLPHPKYAGKRIPAFDMIRWSVNTHRGCWGGCAFCTISMHQGKFVVSRSEESVLREVREIMKDPEFKGYLSDLGGPSANMYMMRGKDEDKCRKCHRPSCAWPQICPNMNIDHAPLLRLYRDVDALKGIKKSFIGSGVRYDVAMHKTGDKRVDAVNREYIEELIINHVSGRLKVAPEHTSDKVLQMMRKPSFGLFFDFKKIFDEINIREGLRQQIIPYFISSHPGCEMRDMQELSKIVRKLDFRLEQVQDFTPTPMTYATEMFHAGIDPYTGKKVYVARKPQEKQMQKGKFFE